VGEEEATMTDGALEAASLVQLCVQRLRREILSGVLPPGERLIEEQLTARFAISRGPVREALRELAQQGLAEYLPRRGMRVAELSAADADELFGLRDVLERYALEVALTSSGGAGLAGLTAAWQEMAAAARAGDAFQENDAHQKFHVEVVALAGQRHLLAAFEPVILKLQLRMATNLRLEAENRADASQGVARHRRLLDAIATGEVTTAVEALAAHGARTYIG
jgi:DNA-binding GntR family transcriptional regulator